MKRFLFLFAFMLVMSSGCSNKVINLTPPSTGVDGLIPYCDGGLWASRTEHTSAFGITKGLAHGEALYFCCPGTGTKPICHRALWKDRKAKPKAKPEAKPEAKPKAKPPSPAPSKDRIEFF